MSISIDEIHICRRLNIQLFNQIKLSTFYSLVGCASKKMRAISFNYEHETKSIETIFIFDSELTEEEEDEMQVANTEVLADVHNEVTGYFWLTLKVVPSSESIIGTSGNWGWIYLRKEY